MKSDDVVGRVKTYESIVKGQNIPTPGIPESFKVLIKELQSLGLDMKVLDQDDQEIDLKQTFDDDDMGLTHGGSFDEENVADDLDGYYQEDEDGNFIDDDEDDDGFDDDLDDDFGLDDGDEDF